MGEDKQPFDRWLIRTLFLLTACLLAATCFLLYRLSMVAYRVETSITSISKDVQAVTSSAASLAEKVDRIVARLDAMEYQFKEELKIDQAKQFFDEVHEVRDLEKNNTGKLSESSKAEIQALLAEIKGSSLRFGHDGDEHSAYNYYVRLYGKYEAYKDALTSAEDFINRAGTKTVGGEPYYAILKSGEKQPLKDWLTERLKQLRAQAAANAQGAVR